MSTVTSDQKGIRRCHEPKQREERQERRENRKKCETERSVERASGRFKIDKRRLDLQWVLAMS